MNPEDQGKLNFIRGLVRPAVTFAVAASFLFIVIYLAVHYASQSMADKLLDRFDIIVVMVFSLYFAFRELKKIAK